jgi:phosphoribosylanthranilate isomerase
MKKKSPLIKICGLTQACDALLAASLGADMCGFIFHPPSPRNIEAAKVRSLTTPGARRVGVFVKQSAAEIISIMHEAQLDMAQLHGEQDRQTAKAIGPEKVIRVFWPERYSQPLSSEGIPLGLCEDMQLWKELAAFFLFDSGVKEGGHGRKLESPFINSPKPYLLAGGLGPQDISKIWQLSWGNLCGFDFNSGVEKTSGIKDPLALKKLFDKVKSLIES